VLREKDVKGVVVVGVVVEESEDVVHESMVVVDEINRMSSIAMVSLSTSVPQ